MGNQYARKSIEWVVNENNCFECISHHKNKDGYSKIKINGKMVFLHRYIYEECFGFIPNDMIVRHKCDNPSCINPEHLQLGTHKDNMCDKKDRKRGRTCDRKGEKNTQAKLTKEQVYMIRKDNRKQREIALDYGVSRQLISKIKTNKRWR